MGLLAAFTQTPRPTAAVMWAASRKEAMVVEYLVNIGLRVATERTLHFMLEMGARLRQVEMAERTGCKCPLSHYMQVDALGLSAVHTNRLRRAGMVDARGGEPPDCSAALQMRQSQESSHSSRVLLSAINGHGTVWRDLTLLHVFGLPK